MDQRKEKIEAAIKYLFTLDDLMSGATTVFYDGTNDKVRNVSEWDTVHKMPIHAMKSMIVGRLNQYFYEV